jgi:hypothetical protein
LWAYSADTVCRSTRCATIMFIGDWISGSLRSVEQATGCVSTP